MCNISRTVNSQVVVSSSITWIKKYTLYISEYKRHEYCTYVTLMVINDILLLVTHWNQVNYSKNLTSTYFSFQFSIQTDFIQGLIWLKWSTSNDSVPSGNKPGGCLIISHLLKGGSKCKTIYCCIYLIVFFSVP